MGDSEDEVKALLSEETIQEIIKKEVTAALSSIPEPHSADKVAGHSGKDGTARSNVCSEREGR